MSVVREFYTNLAAHMLKRVQVHGVVVAFSAKFINQYYNLEPVKPEAYDRLHEHPNYPEVLRMLTNRQGEWELDNKGTQCTSRPNTWPTFLRYDITSSHRVSSRRLMCVK